MAIGRIPGIARRGARHTEGLGLSRIRTNVSTLKGRHMAADIIVASELSESIRRDIDLWTG
jgi:hypothetical protein